MRSTLIVPAVMLTLASCADEPRPTIAEPFGGPPALARADVGAVFTISNATAGNAVLVYARGVDGTLTPAGAVPTGGTGTGGGLGSQGALVLARGGHLIVVVNAGSNSITSFRVQGGTPELVSTVPSGGMMPTSVDVRGDLVYVLNAGGSGNISGFRVDSHGALTAIPGSTRPLSSASAAPAQVSFTPRGDALVVAERATNVLSVYTLDDAGRAQGPTVVPSAGMTPFGFAFAGHDVLLVSEAFGGAADASATSSYRVGARGVLSLVSGSVKTTETAACWVAITPNGKFAYVTNTASGSVSGYRVNHDGALTLLDADGRTGVTGSGSGPIDATMSRDGRFLYTLNAGSRTISTFAIGVDGALTPVGAVAVVAGSAGLIGR